MSARRPPPPELEAQRSVRTRRYQLGALLVMIAGVAVVLISILASGSTSDLRPGKPVPGASKVLGPYAGIPQRGIELGDRHAPVTLVELGDLQCPSCAQFSTEALPQIVSRYVRPGKVLLVFRALDPIGKDSLLAARMALAVGEQNRLFEFNALMYANQGLENSGYVTGSYLRALAGAIPGVDVDRALAARGSAAVRAQLSEAKQLGLRLQIAGTPSFLLYRTGAAPQRFKPAGLGAGSFTAALRRLLGGASP
ncbi:MAG TPA: thioredoxin domain-containing protein [Solirubrobacteraceae bacterium]|nr:thioredoxin domain-containing protein [Solirubrobacteraceae bacterium]